MRYAGFAAAWLWVAAASGMAADGDTGSVLQPRQLERPPAPSVASQPPAPQPAAPRPSPVPITACDPNGCRDGAGNRYNGRGPGMIRGDGKLCQQVGNTMQCN